MASYRYRSYIPAKQIGASINEGEADVLVFSKPVLQDLYMAREAKGEAKIVVDICDNHFNHPGLGPVYKEILSLSDAAVCPTEYMAHLIRRLTGKEACVISDPYEEAYQRPHANGDKRLWFGHESNLKDIEQHKWIGNLTILSGSDWSPKAQYEALRDNNIVVLPTSPGSEYKSPNRLVNSVRGGCFVVADKHPAYVEFKKMMWVGPIGQGIQYSKCFVNELNDRVTECQTYIKKFSPENIGAQWKSFLASV